MSPCWHGRRRSSPFDFPRVEAEKAGSRTVATGGERGRSAGRWMLGGCSSTAPFSQLGPMQGVSEAVHNSVKTRRGGDSTCASLYTVPRRSPPLYGTGPKITCGARVVEQVMPFVRLGVSSPPCSGPRCDRGRGCACRPRVPRRACLSARVDARRWPDTANLYLRKCL